MTAFLDLLELPGSRYAANAVLAPLRAASVRACFGIGENDLEGIRDAVRRAGIRWGRDACHRTELDVPASPNHNWRHGLRRLLLGYAMDADADADVLLGDITPCALDRWGFRSGAADYERLGRFLRYCELAFALDDWSQVAKRPREWAATLRSDVLDRFFGARHGSTPEVSRELSTVARLIDDFAVECGHAGTDTLVSFAVLRDVLREHAAATTRGVPRLADGVTVAGLTVGQALPAKVVCAVGMNDGAFPRRPRAMPFDFLTDLFGENARRLGDRDQRDDDRYSFLEVILAARRCLLLTYTGRDLQEDKPIPPSLVVSELIEYLDRRVPGAAGNRGPGRWQTRHPLQPFSPRYFRREEPALFSYSAPMAAAATALGAAGGVPDRFAGELAGGAAAPETEIELDDLIRFAVSPSRHFARHRLGLHLDVRDDELDDDEPFQLDALQSWQLKSDLADWDQSSEDRAARLAAAGGLLPPGNMAGIQHRSPRGGGRTTGSLAPLRGPHRQARGGHRGERHSHRRGRGAIPRRQERTHVVAHRQDPGEGPDRSVAAPAGAHRGPRLPADGLPVRQQERRNRHAGGAAVRGCARIAGRLGCRLAGRPAQAVAVVRRGVVEVDGATVGFGREDRLDQSAME